jgi:SSS family solute:Na+ symporter
MDPLATKLMPASMHTIEAGLMVAYLAAIVAAGPLARRLVGRADDFFLAGGSATFARGLATLVLIFVGGGSLGVSGLGFSTGLFGSWYYLAYCLGFVILAATFLTSLRVLSRVTIGEILGQRFGSQVARVSSLVTLAAWVFLLASLLATGGRLLEITFGIAYWQGVLVTTLVTVISASIGGMVAVTALSWAQAGLLVAAIAILFAFTLASTGGWGPAFARLPVGFESVLPATQVGVAYALLLIIAPTTVVAPDVYLNVWSLVDARTARRTIWTLVGVIAMCGVMLAFIGAAARLSFPHAAPEQALPLMARGLLPPVVAGVVLVALIGAAISGAVPETVVCASVLTRDLFLGWVWPLAGNRSVLLASRVSVVLVGLTALVLAVSIPEVVDLALHAYRIFVPAIVPQVLAALFVSWARPQAVMASMVAGPAVVVVQGLLLPNTLRSFADPVGPGILAAVLVLVVGSLLSQSGTATPPLLSGRAGQ